MLRVTALISLIAGLLFTTGAEAQSADRFTGKYDIACQRSSITASINLAGGVGLSNTGNHQHSISLRLSCNKNDPTFLASLEQVALDFEASCRELTLGQYTKCAEAGQAYADALYDVNSQLIDLTPRYADMRVSGTSDWGNILFNLYPFNGSVRNAAGATSPAQFFINGSGQFGTGGLQINGGDGLGAPELGLGCVSWATAGVDGSIATVANKLQLTANYNMNGNLTCGGAHSSQAWFLVNIGLSLQGSVQGVKR